MVAVSYLTIVIYLTFVIGSTLLVGLLPPLVNRPECKDEENNAATVLADGLFDNRESVQVRRERREVDDSAQRKLLEDQSFMREHIARRVSEDPIFARIMASRAPLDSLPNCTEITNPQAGFEYPWYDPRLPTDITPVNYNIQVLLDNLNVPIYDGFIDITFNVVSATNFILLHIGSKSKAPTITAFTDKDGVDVSVNCSSTFLFVRNDYYIIKTDAPLTPAQSPYLIKFLFVDTYTGVDNGIFKINYGPASDNSTMFLSKFRPIDARRSFPIFDEPGFKATYDMTIYHRTDFAAVFNTPVKTSAPDSTFPTIQVTTFEQTPPMPTAYIALSVLNPNDFGAVTAFTLRSDIPITVWARKQFIDAGFGVQPLEMCVKIFDALDDILRGVTPQALPPKIDVLVAPEYPVNAIGHFGLPIFQEDKILFKNTSASHRDVQKVALLVAHTFAEFWFGNFITQPWWDELWTQEGFVEYLQYRAVDEAYPDWNFLDQFLTIELVQTIIDDGFPSSHPILKPITNAYEIEEFFDSVETTKTAAVIRMVENEFNYADTLNAIYKYLNATPWGVADINTFYNSFAPFGNGWTMKDFFDRWTKQANYPLVQVELVDNAGTQNIVFNQIRGVNSNNSIFADTLLYPSPWNFTWFIPIDCSFGNGSGPDSAVRERTYYLDSTQGTFAVPNQAGVTWTWVHCDRKFIGYYELQYTTQNWLLLGQAMKQENDEFVSEDRAQIIHNLFLNAYSGRTNYSVLRNVLEYLPIEEEYLPWRTTLIHVNRMSSVLAYTETFYEISQFFAYVTRVPELSFDVWQNEGGSFVDELFKETIIDLACHMQEPFCLANATLLWPDALAVLQTEIFENASIPGYARQFVYNYHIENTYDVEDWDIIFRDYLVALDLNEQRKAVTSLTYSRLPWLVSGIISGLGPGYLDRYDFFEVSALLAARPTGREIMWDRFRLDIDQILTLYSEDDPRIGWLLIAIVESFENEFLFRELLEFVFETPSGATANARFKALEIASTNIIWLQEKEAEIKCAFRLMGCFPEELPKIKRRHPLVDAAKSHQPLAASLKEQFLNKLRETDLEIFDNYKKIML